MSTYQLLLFVHLLALVAASATSSVVHLAQARARSAASLAEMGQWLAFGGSTVRLFPVATLVLLGTGALMVARHGPWSWSAGWVEAGLAGVTFLLVSGPVLGVRGKRTGRALAGLSAGEVERARALLHDRVSGALSWINTGVALGVVYAMAAKPGLAGSLVALAVGATVGLAVHVASERRAAPAVSAAPRRELAA